MAEEKKVMALLPVTPLHHQNVAAGSVQIDADCGHKAWISPSGLKFHLTDPSIETSCIGCLRTTEPVTLMEIPGSLDEVRAELGDDAARRMVETIRRLFRAN